LSSVEFEIFPTW